ncbi:hypothetical protein EDB74_111150 [Vibrio crassostreae]|uniref:hypothetical protein n=1 Tax=Vibrio crassostreae TaxID=246167 RepID=UPI0010440AAE|nr:hypothetical protein [Vibrio crassostreae]TCV59525.1 hypothetical protein EDB74_111150 [Vibrio crassostreae]
MKNANITAVLSNELNFKNYDYFRKSINVFEKLKFTKSERNSLKAFYQKANLMASSGQSLLGLENELQLLLSSLRIDAAKKRWLKLKQKNKKAGPKKKNGRKPSLKVDLSIDDILESRRGTSQIGLGLESSVVIPKINSKDVVIDKHTDSNKIVDKHILYAAGWSLEGAFSK